jgi:hypothetical protein
MAVNIDLEGRVCVVTGAFAPFCGGNVMPTI